MKILNESRPGPPVLGKNIHTQTFFTAGDLAKILKVSVSTIYRLAQVGKIPVVKIGRSVRFSPTLIKNWLEEGNGNGT